MSPLLFNRRQMLQMSGAALMASGWLGRPLAPDPGRKKVL